MSEVGHDSLEFPSISLSVIPTCRRLGVQKGLKTSLSRLSDWISIIRGTRTKSMALLGKMAARPPAPDSKGVWLKSPSGI